MIVVMIMIVLVTIIIVIIHHLMLDLLGIEFHYFSMFGIFDIIARITGLKSLHG